MSTGELTGEHPFAHLDTTVPGGAGTGTLVVLPANVGGATTSVSAPTEVHLGPLPAGVLTAGPATGTEWECPGSAAGQSEVSCITTKAIASLAASPYPINVPVEVSSQTPLQEEVPVTIQGGGASIGADTFMLPIVVSTEPAGFGLSAIWAGAYEADGSPSTQAGGHPHGAASYIMANTIRNARGEFTPVGDLRDVLVDLQPGFVGNPLATKRCPQDVLLEIVPEESPLCTKEMSVGTLVPYVGSLTGSISFEGQGLFNDVPVKGYPAEFSTRLKFPIQSVLASIRSEEDYGVRISAFNNATFEKIFGAFAAFEGTPKQGTGKALLTNPTDCAEQARETPVLASQIDSWQNPGNFIHNPDVALPPVTGCKALELHPRFSLQPTSTQGSSPVGATAHLHLPDAGLTDPEAIAEPQVKKAVVKLPEGLDLNPSSANGLQTCTEAQIGYRGSGFDLPNPMRFTEAQPSCPDGSKLGSVEVKTPLLDNPLVGQVYLAAQEENPFGTLLAIYLVVERPPDRRRRQAAGPHRHRPEHGPDHHHLRLQPPAALRRPDDPLPRRRGPLRARQPRSLRPPHHHRQAGNRGRRPNRVPTPRPATRSTSRATARAPPARGPSPRASKRARPTRSPAPTPRWWSRSSETTENRSCAASTSPCPAAWRQSSPACPTAQTPTSPPPRTSRAAKSRPTRAAPPRPGSAAWTPPAASAPNPSTSPATSTSQAATRAPRSPPWSSPPRWRAPSTSAT